MTEALPPATSIAASQRPPLTTTDSAQFNHHASIISLTTEDTLDDDDGEIACICAFSGDDGNTIQCDKCLRWQHISCYYPSPKEVPGEDQKHYCTDCVPQDDLDARKATERQKRALEMRNSINGIKRSAAKAKQKKAKDSPSLTAQANGWPDRHNQIHGHDRKSASPRDQPPPAKKPKISHRATNSVSHAPGRRRDNTSGASNTRSSSKSPDPGNSAYIPHYSEEFLHLFEPQSPQVETDTNLMNNIAVTNLLSDWLTDSEAVGSASGGLKQSEIFKRWDGRMEDIPGIPEVVFEWVEEPASKDQPDSITARWARLTVQQEIASGTFIGELRGRIGHKGDYTDEPDSRWALLHHPEPFVFFHPLLPICIDARQEGSIFRFVRRSCQPNAELQTIITEGTEYHFCFMAKKDILAGEEVTIAWQVPDTIRDLISSSLTSLTPSNNFQPATRDYISTWVSNVLANCGPCACSGETSCLMAHYDRRGRPPPTPLTRPTRRKRKLPVLDAVPTRSRSASVVRRVENEDDVSESRSTSGSHASQSRDITPSTHYSGSVRTAILPEMSEREKKKLMREEEMFRKQEAESGRPKKKRPSGGSTLNTPGASTATRVPTSERPISFADMDGQRTNGTSGYRDAGTSSRPERTSRDPHVKRRAAAHSRTESRLPTRAIPPVYAEASTQCDLDAEGKLSLPDRPRRRYISVSQRLLQKCVASIPKRKLSSLGPQVESPEAMNTDSKVEPEKSLLHEAPEQTTTPDIVMEEDSSPTFAPDAADVDMTMADDSPKPPISIQADSPPIHMAQDLSRHPAGLPASANNAPEPQTAPVSSGMTEEQDMPMEKVGDIANMGPKHARPAMHLDMPPPLLSSASTYSQSGAIVSTPSLLLTQSGLVGTPGPLPALLNPIILSPSVASAVIPSPIRKKMSLSDYTKRSKARESTGGDSASGMGQPHDLKEKDDESPVAARSVSPGPSSTQQSAKMDEDDSAPKEGQDDALPSAAHDVVEDVGQSTAKTVEDLINEAQRTAERIASEGAPVASMLPAVVQDETPRVE